MYDDLVYRQEVEYAGGMTPWRLIIIMIIGFLLGAMSSAYAQQPQQQDHLENNWMMQEQAHATQAQNSREAVIKLIQDRRNLLQMLKNEREYWAAYVKGLEAPPKE